jgi:hypothetical protein
VIVAKGRRGAQNSAGPTTLLMKKRGTTPPSTRLRLSRN